ncbi:MAG: ribonuclease J, partial [Desulfovibrio sp.]|nr:ribonuclease J [Desulfovibrio sp.]
MEASLAAGEHSRPALKITPLGGLGEIGLNCQIWECGNHSVMIDCGLMFPDDHHYGVDVLIPNFEAVRSASDHLRGIILTHGHEDHIGALPWIVPELRGISIYGSRFTLALARHKLEEHGLLSQVELCPVDASTVLPIGDMRFHFFPVCHSIPHGFGLGVETPAGRIIHSGDFKLDPDPLDGEPTDINAFREFAGPEGCRLLLSDSTNVLREGRSLPEREVMASLDKVFQAAKGRLVITLFSTHIQRIQEVFDLARKHGRSVIISGKSLANNIDIATELGDCRLPPDFHNAYYGLPDLPDDKVALVVTGAQGEPLSALSRMVFGGHRQLAIQKGDTVIMSSRVIPGNARAISRMINEMCRLGADVYYESSNPVHASGHAYRDELREMLEATRPELFVPVHGEYMHLALHGRLAANSSVAPECIVLEDGRPLALYEDGYEIMEPIAAEYTTVDGKGVGDVGATVLRERRILGDEG